MSIKRASIAKLRTLRIDGIDYSVPRFVHRHIVPAGWSVRIAGIRRYFSDVDYGSIDDALYQAKLFLSKVMAEDPTTLLRYAQINVTVHASVNGVSVVHGSFKYKDTGNDMSFHIGNVKPEVDPWPTLTYAIQELPSWLAVLDYANLKSSWLEMHRAQIQHIYLHDDFKKFLEELLIEEHQTVLAFFD